MTDERIGDRLWQAIDRLPADDGGIIFRHYGLDERARLELGRKVAAAARERRLVLAVASSGVLAAELGASLIHNPPGVPELPFSLSVHDETQAKIARERGAALAFIAPVYGTRSHPGTVPLGVARAAILAQLASCQAIALGGMNEVRFEALGRDFPGLFYGYAGIDCWLDR
jgi:thiamine-phosphate pyrophosphorylase